MFCIYLRTNSDFCHLQHKLIGFYNRDEKCLQRGTNWGFKYSGLRFVFKWSKSDNVHRKCARHLRGRRVLSVITLWTASYGPIIYRAFCFHDQFCGNPEIGGSVSECCPSLCYFCNISLTVILLTWHKLSSNSVVFELWYESLKCVHSYELFWRKFNIKIATINIIGLLCHFIVFLYISCTGEADKSSARTEKKQPNVSVRMVWISFGALSCRKKKTWWQLASRYCWNRARLWHASEFVSFLVGLKTYQHTSNLTGRILT